MNIDSSLFLNEEKAIFALRSLYRKHGYARFKMSKFEEYALYAQNKDFLISDNIITFTDINGKLMALKPDVTLSIIKSGRDSDIIQKVCYDEKVYRASKTSYGFKEITQVGLEAIGKIDRYTVSEVLLLAVCSLAEISDDYVLDISHLGILSAMVSALCLTPEKERAAYKAIGERNLHELREICSGCDAGKLEILCETLSLYGHWDEVLPRLDKLIEKSGLSEVRSAFETLCGLIGFLRAEQLDGRINIDFSVINDMSYYNGIVFNGFINGIPERILSGGQYDNLMHKMGRSSGALGFALYLDLLDRFGEESEEYDADKVLLYTENANAAEISAAVAKLSADNSSVLATGTLPEKIKYKQLYRFPEDFQNEEK